MVSSLICQLYRCSPRRQYGAGWNIVQTPLLHQLSSTGCWVQCVCPLPDPEVESSNISHPSHVPICNGALACSRTHEERCFVVCQVSALRCAGWNPALIDLFCCRDPQDPTFHPIRDILDRPTLGQLRKLGISAIMYAVVIAGGIGIAVYFLSFVWTPYQQLLPLRWNSRYVSESAYSEHTDTDIICRHPLSELPVDLLFLHIVLPTILESIKPRELISPFCHAWWEHAAHEFRLTSFLFGDRVMEEEVGSRFTWRRFPLIRDLAWVRRDEVERPDDGGFARVPASDSVAFPENLKQMLIPTDEAGTPLDHRGAELIQAQNEAARKAQRDPAEDYQIVYLPPNFTKRVIAFMCYLWATGSAITVVTLGTPILLGRRILDQIPGMPVHDGYSFLVGSTAAWAIVVILGFFSRRYNEIREQQAINRTSMPKATNWERAKVGVDLYLGGTLRTSIWAFNHIITWTMLGFVIPLLMATVLQLYIILPIRVGVYPHSEGLVATLHLWEDWALGCVLAAIMIRVGRMQPRSPLLRAWDTVRSIQCLRSALMVADRVQFARRLYEMNQKALTSNELSLISLVHSRAACWFLP